MFPVPGDLCAAQGTWTPTAYPLYVTFALHDVRVVGWVDRGSKVLVVAVRQRPIDTDIDCLCCTQVGLGWFSSAWLKHVQR